MRVGLGFDVHPFSTDPSRRLVLGGVEVPGAGLAGHSDADVIAHAVADSMLGPAGLPDLGALFPASDPSWKDADSMAMLVEVVVRVRDRGWQVANVDVVVAAERPKLAEHVPAMADRLTQALSARGGDPFVSVTPKHGEGVGAIGRGEAIAAWAVTLLERR